jgi:hypothetical protein
MQDGTLNALVLLRLGRERLNGQLRRRRIMHSLRRMVMMLVMAVWVSLRMILVEMHGSNLRVE